MQVLNLWGISPAHSVQKLYFNVVPSVSSWGWLLCYMFCSGSSCLPQHVEENSLWISLRSFSFSGFKLGSLINFELIVVPGTRYEPNNSILLQVESELCQHCWKGCLIQCVFLSSLSELSGHIFFVVLFLGPLFCSIGLPIYYYTSPGCLYYCSSVVLLEARYCNVFSSVLTFGCSWSFIYSWFHMNSWILSIRVLIGRLVLVV